MRNGRNIRRDFKDGSLNPSPSHYSKCVLCESPVPVAIHLHELQERLELLGFLDKLVVENPLGVTTNVSAHLGHEITGIDVVHVGYQVGIHDDVLRTVYLIHAKLTDVLSNFLNVVDGDLNSPYNVWLPNKSSKFHGGSLFVFFVVGPKFRCHALPGGFSLMAYLRSRASSSIVTNRVCRYAFVPNLPLTAQS
jgi:hypothetical protein